MIAFLKFLYWIPAFPPSPSGYGRAMRGYDTKREGHKIMTFKKKFIYPFVLIILFVAIFGFGFFVGENIGKNTVVCKTCKPEAIDFSLFWNAREKLQKTFIDPTKITDQKIIYGAIDGMTEGLGDPYTDFFDPEQAKIFNEDLSGSFSGIGVEIGIKKNQLTVVSPIEGTPGDKAGLKAGDMILKINSKDTAGISTEEAVKLIRGPKGTVVSLNVYRENWGKARDIKITRDTIKIDSVKWELKNNDVAYIKIRQFDQNLSSDLKKVVFEVLSSSAKKIVLDLRNNPGGYLDTAQEIAGWFLKTGQTVVIEDFGKNKEQIFYKANGPESLLEYPIVVLINQGSASASEILAGALRDNRNVKLIGEKSFGKGSVQTLTDLPDGSFLKITVAKWLTPKGNSISDVGLAPDFKIEITENDFDNNKDPQLDKALEIIRGLK